ncbi:MAG: SnoaL-like domain [Thermoleophilaceae bacterium]|jgi:ketosteroid isomerase-like protein|nr:SnoaL-like domain [Thermoleophilaceae bacterium]
MTPAKNGHVELVRRGFRLYADGDFEGLWALVHPDVELAPIFMPGTYRGLAAVRDALAGGGDPRLRWSASELEFHEVGELVVVVGRLHARAVLGAPLNLPIAFVVHVRERLITRMEGHMTLAQAVDAALD